MRSSLPPLRAVLATALGLACAAPLAWVVSCDSNPNTPPPDGGGAGGTGGAPDNHYHPTGCSFEIVPRPEYTDWQIGQTTVGSAPGITRVRIGLGGKIDVGVTGRADPSTTVGFLWETTDDATLVSEVQWGSTPEPATWPTENRASGVSWLTPPGFINPAGDERMHEVHVCGLTPDTTYYYRVGGGPAGQELWSEVLSFRTTPAAGADTEVVIGVSGDARGQGNDAWRLIQQRMLLEAPTFQMFSGDMVNLATDQEEWEHWLDLGTRDTDDSPLAMSSQLLLGAHGNHESHTTFFYGNLAQPADEAAHPTWGELVYSVDVGPVHAIVFDDSYVANPNLDPAFLPAFETWLRADLEAAVANRANVPWIVAMHHRGEFSSSLHSGDGDVADAREFLVPIWHEYAVDLVVAGHDHDYERTKLLSGPLSNLVIQEIATGTGTLYAVVAGAGAPAYGANTSPTTDISLAYDEVASFGFYAFLRFTKTSLSFETHELRADASDPIVDSVTIAK
jgi:hypothetical protein